MAKVVFPREALGMTPIVKLRRPYRPSVETVEDRTVPTTFSTLSPTSGGALPPGVSPVGGIVLDLIGVNGRRVVSQVAAGALFRGMFDDGEPVAFRGNPGTISPSSYPLFGVDGPEPAITLNHHVRCQSIA